MTSPGHTEGTADGHSLGRIARQCPSRMLLELLADKWTLLVIGVLDERPTRFNELRRTVEGISQRMLTQTLRRLESLGFVDRVVHTGSPVRVEYRLTELGRSLREPVTALWQWTETHIDLVPDLARSG